MCEESSEEIIWHKKKDCSVRYEEKFARVAYY